MWAVALEKHSSAYLGLLDLEQAELHRLRFSTFQAWSEWKSTAQEAKKRSRKCTPPIVAGRPVPHLQEVTEAAMRVFQGLGALIESEMAA